MSHATLSTTAGRAGAFASSTHRIAAAVAVFLVLALAGIDPAHAQGLEKVNTGIESLLTFLRGISIAVVTIAIIWAGYKMIFKHAEMGEIIKILGGGIFIGCAAEIARFLLQ